MKINLVEGKYAQKVKREAQRKIAKHIKASIKRGDKK